MEITELMIGDFVKYGDEFIRVDEIQKGKIFWDKYQDGFYQIIEVDKIEPIPINREFLEHNGFTKDSTYDVYEMKVPVERSVKCKLKHYCYSACWMLDLLAGDSYISLDMCSVHQLQHAFRLANIKGEWNLNYGQEKGNSGPYGVLSDQ